MLFHIAIFSTDELSCIQAQSLLLELFQRHSGFKLDLVRCIPSQEEFLSVWDQLSMCERERWCIDYSEIAIDLNGLLHSHTELRTEIYWEGSLKSCELWLREWDIALVEAFPLLQFSHYLQLLVFVLGVLGDDRDHFSEETLMKLLERLVRCLLEPRTVLLREVLCECVAGVISVIQRRGM